MDVFRFVVVIALLAVTITWVLTAPCPENYCESVKCSVENENCDFELSNATRCGCCPVCINYTKEGDDCFPLHLNDIGRSGLHCGPQLSCDNKTCRKKTTACLTKLKNYNTESDLGYLLIGKDKPHCDDNGNFFRKQCRSGSMCYCVDHNGDRIFGETNDYLHDETGCACSRKFHDLKRFLNGTSLGNWFENLNPLEKFLHCSATGDYDVLQCVGNECFCINDILQRDSKNVTRNKFRNLPCYNPNIHSEVYWRPCELALNRTLMYITKQTSDKKMVVGLDVPVCDLDGSYAPKQCRGDRCYCMDKDGNPINSYSAKRYTSKAKNMKCECARENIFLDKHGLAKQMDCSETGDYKQIQCLRATCYCVDETGNQFGKEFDKDDPKPCIK